MRRKCKYLQKHIEQIVISLLVQVNTCGAQRCWSPLALGRQRKREHVALNILEASDLSLQVMQYLLAQHQHGNRITGFERLCPWSGLYPLKKIEQLNFFFFFLKRINRL